LVNVIDCVVGAVVVQVYSSAVTFDRQFKGQLKTFLLAQ